MDDRQTQIREGAGLDESRINQDFLRFISKWSTPVLVLLAVVAAGYYLLEQQKTAAQERRGIAFAEFEAARSTEPPNPEALLAIADDYEGVGSVAELARIEAADTLVREAQRGVKYGAELDDGGAPFNDEDKLEGEAFEAQMRRAGEIYQRVFNRTRGDRAKVMVTVGAGFGLAACQESVGDFEAARGTYREIAEAARAGGVALHAKVAERRLKSIEDGELDNPNLPYRFELPPGQMIVAAGAQGSPRTIPREGADDPRYQDFRREQRLREQGLLGPEDPDAGGPGGPGGPVGPVLPEGPVPEAPAPESTTDDPGADEPPVDPDDDGGR